MRSYVVDASVATRFLLKEDLTEKAEAVLRSYVNGVMDMVAPPLIGYEAGNALRTAVSRGIVDGGEASESFRRFLRLELGRLSLSDDEYRDALEWSVRKSVSYYDGVYIWASKVSGFTLLTGDDRQIEAARGEVETLHLSKFE